VLIAAMVALVSCNRGPSSEQLSAAMRQDLGLMRKAIRDFRTSQKRHPAKLDDLVRHKFITRIPNDPVTGTANWHLVTEEPVSVDEFKSGTRSHVSTGIVDVRSAAPGRDARGKPWSEY
jgi:general secretion pathway protein G